MLKPKDRPGKKNSNERNFNGFFFFFLSVIIGFLLKLHIYLSFFALFSFISSTLFFFCVWITVNRGRNKKKKKKGEGKLSGLYRTTGFQEQFSKFVLSFFFCRRNKNGFLLETFSKKKNFIFHFLFFFFCFCSQF